MQIKYFSWIRETIGKAEETVIKPDHVRNVSDLLEHLSGASEGHEAALKERVFVKVAVNQVHAEHNTVIKNSDEIALFPPVTGG